MTTAGTAATSSSSSAPPKASGGFLVSAIAGGISGVITRTAAAPAERIKLILQTQNINTQLKMAGRSYSGVFDCIKQVYATQGFLSFWRGNIAALARNLPNQALSFAFKDALKPYLVPSKPDPNSARYFFFVAGNLACGGIAGGMALTMLYPLDLVRTKLAADIGSSSSKAQEANYVPKKFSGIIDCMKKIVAESGIRGLYSGYVVSLTGVMLFRALYFGGYDAIKNFADLDSNDTPFIKRFAAAQLNTTVVGTLCYPLDTIKRRLMMQAEGDQVYGGIVDCLRKVVKEEGVVKGLYPGLSVNIFRGVFGALMLVLYDQIKPMLE